MRLFTDRVEEVIDVFRTVILENELPDMSRWNDGAPGIYLPHLWPIDKSEEDESNTPDNAPEPDCEKAEPAQGATPEALLQPLAEDESEASMAAVYATIDNQITWLEDKIEGLYIEEEYEKASELHTQIRQWTEIRADLVQIIRSILYEEAPEGIALIEDSKLMNGRTLVTPFLKRNGYRDVDGWWVKEKESDTEHT